MAKHITDALSDALSDACMKGLKEGLVRPADCRHAGNYSDEDAFNCDTDKFDKRRIKIICPHCHKVFAALCSNHTIEIDSGWRWANLDYKEPYATFQTTCPKCKKPYTFTTHTPQ